jgi:putative MATE family efflux protein
VLDEAQLLRSVNRLAFPIIAENLFQTALGIVDLIMVGRLGANAIAGVGTALQLIFIVIAALSAVTIGTTVLVARFVGEERPAQADHTLKQSLLLGVALSAAIAVLGGACAHPLIGLLGASPAVTRIGGDYLQITCLTSVALVIQLVCSGALRGAGDTKTSMIVTGLVNLVNVLLAYGLIFGHFGLPALGAAGSAWGASLARAAGAVVLLALLATHRRRVGLRGRAGWRPDLALMRRITAIGFPAMIEQMLMNGGMLLYSIIVIDMGTAIYAAQRITFNIINISFMPGLGFGMAATTMTSQALGAQRPDLARHSTTIALRLALAWMCTMGLAMIVWGPTPCASSPSRSPSRRSGRCSRAACAGRGTRASRCWRRGWPSGWCACPSGGSWACRCTAACLACISPTCWTVRCARWPTRDGSSAGAGSGGASDPGVAAEAPDV